MAAFAERYATTVRESFLPRLAQAHAFLGELARSPLAVVGLLLICGFALMAILAPVLAPPQGPDPYEMRPDFDNQLQPPGPGHPFGTSVHGVDLYYGVVWGSRISMMMGLSVVAAVVLIGTILGGISGYVGGRVDEIIMRVTDVFLAVPALILAMGVAAAFGRTLEHLGLALIVVSWPGYARLVRGQVLSTKENAYVEAANALGLSRPRVIFRHILPNCLSPIIVNATLDIGQVVLLAAGLAFIGFAPGGPLLPEWGSLVNVGQNYFVGGKWWTIAFPGAAIFGFALGFNLLGDGLRDVLDPRIRK